MDDNRIDIWDDDVGFLTNLANAVFYLMQVDNSRLQSLHDAEIARGNNEEAAKWRQALDDQKNKNEEKKP